MTIVSDHVANKADPIRIGREFVVDAIRQRNIVYHRSLLLQCFGLCQSQSFFNGTKKHFDVSLCVQEVVFNYWRVMNGVPSQGDFTSCIRKK